MTIANEKIIEQQKLENGIELLLYDCSRLVAGDRWLVELRCEAHMVIDETYWNLVPNDEPTLPEIREILGDRLSFITTKQRNFVDEGEREPVLREMVQQVYSSMLEYLKRPHFPQEYFKKQYNDVLQQVLYQREMNNKTDTC